MGGCTYHVVHPGGRNYQSFPVNANEAEARRVARFVPNGHTTGLMTLRDEVPSRDFSLMLDLRCEPDYAVAFTSPSPEPGRQQCPEYFVIPSFANGFN